jgi:hypothetical protein
VPYAVSLALSVEYRKMRHTRLPMFRARARSAFKSNCDLLRRFGDVFWSARVVAGLGERVLKEMERAANSIAQEATPLPLMIGDTHQNGSSNGLINHNRIGHDDPQALSNSDLSGRDNGEYSLVDALPNLDVFGHFDPSFNLTAVDNVLESNLDIGLPFNWSEWASL